MDDSKKELENRTMPQGTQLDPQEVEEFQAEMVEQMKPLIDEEIHQQAEAMARAPFIVVTN